MTAGSPGDYSNKPNFLFFFYRTYIALLIWSWGIHIEQDEDEKAAIARKYLHYGVIIDYARGRLGSSITSAANRPARATHGHVRLYQIKGIRILKREKERPHGYSGTVPCTNDSKMETG